jgi:hypothetical protein
VSDSADRAHGAPGGHERRDIDARPIVGASVALAVVITLVAIGMRLVFHHYAAREAATSQPANPLAVEAGRQLPPEPRLQTAPIDDIQKLREHERSILDTYGWVDREHGVVRVPIDRAIDLLAERGLPARKKDQANK